MSDYSINYNEPENPTDNPHNVDLEELGEIIYGGKPSALKQVTWDELSLAQQMILEAARKHNVIVATDRDGVLAPYEWPHAAFEKFITDGYLEQFGIGTSYYTRYRLTPAGRALLPAPTLTPSELDAAIYDEKPVLPGDNMSVRQLLEAIAEGLTGDYSASAVACLALEKLNPQGFTAEIDPIAIDTEGAYMNPQAAAEHWKALHESGIEAHAETLERVKVLEAENARLRDVMIEALAFARTGLIPMEFEPYVFDGETRRLHWNEHMRIQIAKLIDAALK